MGSDTWTRTFLSTPSAKLLPLMALLWPQESGYYPLIPQGPFMKPSLTEPGSDRLGPLSLNPLRPSLLGALGDFGLPPHSGQFRLGLKAWAWVG